MRSTRFLAPALAACLLLPAATAATGASPAQPKPIARIRLAGGNWGYPSPFSYIRGPGLVDTLFVFDTLLWKDASGKPIPWLAQSWSRSPDAYTYTFHLHKGVRWQDGQPLTARDVVFTFTYLTTGPGKAVPGLISGGNLGIIKSVTAPNSTTVVFKLSKRFAPFPITIVGAVPIIPQHIWKSVTDPAHFQSPQAVIGSGPYKLAGYDQASGAYKFVANTHYFLGTPVVREIDMVPVSDSLLALRRGDIDAGGPGSAEGTPPASLTPFQKGKTFGRLVAPGEWNRALHFNLAKGFPYNDARFRQAVAYAINRKDLVRRILYGQGTIGSTGGLAPSNPYTAPGLPTYPYNPTKAKQLLNAAGLVDRNGDGWRDLPNGQPFTPTLETSTRFSTATAELIQQYLKAVGINLQVQVLDSNAADAAAATGNYQMALVGYGGLGGEPDNLRSRLSATVQSRSFTHIFGWVNPRFEALGQAEIQTVVDKVRKKEIFEMEQQVAQDLPMLSLYVPTRVWLWRKSSANLPWYYTPGGVFGGYPGTLNKQLFVTGTKYGS